MTVLHFTSQISYPLAILLFVFAIHYNYLDTTILQTTMTPTPSREELAARYIYNPQVESVHVIDLIAQAKDSLYAKDKISDYVIGLLLVAKAEKIVAVWEGSLFQIPFVLGMKLRVTSEHYGRQCYGPDGHILCLQGRILHGTLPAPHDISPLTLDSIREHRGYKDWIRRHLYAGRTKEDTRYTRVTGLNSLKACDTYTNSRPYLPGPLSTSPDQDPEDSNGDHDMADRSSAGEEEAEVEHEFREEDMEENIEEDAPKPSRNQTSASPERSSQVGEQSRGNGSRAPVTEDQLSIADRLQKVRRTQMLLDQRQRRRAEQELIDGQLRRKVARTLANLERDLRRE